MLQIAKGLLDAEAIEAVEDTFFYMDENCAAFDMPGSLAELQVQYLMLKLHFQSTLLGNSLSLRHSAGGLFLLHSVLNFNL